MGIIGYDMTIRKEYWLNFWEVLEGIIGKILSILGSGVFHLCHFHLHMSHKAVKSMEKLITQLCGDLQSAVCLPREDGAIHRSPKHLWTSNRHEKEA